MNFGVFLLLYNMNWVNSSWSLTYATCTAANRVERKRERERERQNGRKVKWVCRIECVEAIERSEERGRERSSDRVSEIERVELKGTSIKYARVKWWSLACSLFAGVARDVKVQKECKNANEYSYKRWRSGQDETAREWEVTLTGQIRGRERGVIE